jgi:TolB-like protein/DNA-binding winged helix-turn-helix (wHTH) protein/Tfp pilus assembly protein PilF
VDSDALKPLRLNGRTVDVQRGTITSGSGQSVTLRPQSAEIFKLLAARPGKLISKDELIQEVWRGIAVTDDSLVQCIAEIRRALRDEQHDIIKTVPKRGYLLEIARSQPSPGRRWTRWVGFAAAAGVAAVAAAYFLPMAKSVAEPPALAELPFETIDGDARWARFANGLTDDIITDLARFRDIPVIARSSTDVYRGAPHDVRDIGKALNVKYVMEGSLRVEGYRMRVTAQLIDAETGAHVWSERYDRPAAELLDVQDEIAEKIAVILTGWQGQVTEAERAHTRRKNKADLDAYDYWLLGIEAKHRMTPESQIEARDYFEKGLKLAPDFMPLVRDIGITHIVDIEIGSAVDYRAAVDAHRKYTERAFELDPNDAEVNYLMGIVYLHMGEDEQTERYQELALKLAPNNPDIRMQMVWALCGWQSERAIELAERMLKLNPRYPSWWNFPIASAYFGARRFDKAYAAAKQTGQSPNQTAYLAMSAAQLGMKDEAGAAAAKLMHMKPGWTAESMFPYQQFRDESLLSESAAKAGLPVCMTAAQVVAYSGFFRFQECEDTRARTAASN